MISVFDMFKVGVGPSSSHTVGPMKAGKAFLDLLIKKNVLDRVDHIQAEVYGSLSLTGRGHNTDIAIIMGLAGYLPNDVDLDLIPVFIEKLQKTSRLPINQGSKEVTFDFNNDLIFNNECLPLHENGMKLKAYANGELLVAETYYSIGGGFIVDEAHFGVEEKQTIPVPYPYQKAIDLVKHCQKTGLSLSAIVRANEIVLHGEVALEKHIQTIYQTMNDCMQRGLNTEGILPGPLKVERRAATLSRTLHANENLTLDPMSVIDWVNMYALAVNEENAAGGRVVTAPTNGACGIVPAVLAYFNKFIEKVSPEIIERYLLTCSVVGSLYKMNASISGAEVGCQGEVGVACSMAAAGLTDILGGNVEQIFCAAEIAMEHNLGLTCDPVAGQVQVPCIERNAIAAVKAINASRMALRRTSRPVVSLDDVIETMYETGKDINAKYRETSQGGLAVKIVCS